MKQTRVLFVCLGNICRSPLAEGILRHIAQTNGASDRLDIDSAGTGSWHIGDPPDRRSVAVAARHGLDISAQRGRRVRTSDFTDFDLILAMDRSNRSNLLAMAPPEERHRIQLFLEYTLGRQKDVPDPYHDDANGFQSVYSMLFEGCSALMDRLEGRRS